MKNSKIKEIVIPAVSLFIICLVVTALLGLTNSVTQPKIEQLAIETQNKTKQVVLSDASSFSDEKTVTLDEKEYTYFDGLSQDGETVGYVFLTSAKGYGGDIEIMVGVDSQGTVKGVAILSISETAGLGMNAKKESFLTQFNGKNSTISVIKTGEAKEDEIQALTGATITSKAMTKAVNTALDLFSQVGGEGNG